MLEQAHKYTVDLETILLFVLLIPNDKQHHVLYDLLYLLEQDLSDEMSLDLMCIT